MTRIHPRLLWTALTMSLAMYSITTRAQAASNVHFDPATKVFRIDAGGMTYAFGINNVDELQPVFWGAASTARTSFPQPCQPEAAAFDSSTRRHPMSMQAGVEASMWSRR